MTENLDSINQGFMDPRPANFVPLSPLSFLRRAATIFGSYDAWIYGDRQASWAECYERAVRLASALQKAGVRPGGVVTLIAANTPEMFEAQFGVAMAGAVLNTVNIRLDTETISYILDHADSQLLISDAAFADRVGPALAKSAHPDIPVIDIVDQQEPASAAGARLGSLDYEAFLATGDPDFDWQLPADEWQAMCLNYTSGTSGRPKGVVYHHRGAYLMAMGTVPAWDVPAHPTYLYTVPMFHCNGWGHAWMLALLAGRAVLTRTLNAEVIFDLLHRYRIDHFGGAPIILGMLVNADPAIRKKPDWPVKVMTAGAPPPAAILEKTEALGFEVMQVYGLTETFGHTVQSAWLRDWDQLDFAARAAIKARQGVCFPHTEGLEVLDTNTGQPVPADGETLGEAVIRSNTVMKGYHKNAAATEASMAGGYFRSGDLAVRHPDGHIEVKDRLKDIIISGGENISSVELEGVLYRHPAVGFAAVVAMPDEKWGESPCAFIELKDGAEAGEAEILEFCRAHLAGFKMPKKVLFGELPKTATGKIQKFELRAALREG